MRIEVSIGLKVAGGLSKGTPVTIDVVSTDLDYEKISILDIKPYYDPVAKQQ